MTIEQRHTQLRGLSLSREMIGGAVADLNRNIIDSNIFEEKMIKEIFAEYIQNATLDDLKNMKMKLVQFGAVDIAQWQISLVNQFYALMIHKILLPDYLGNASAEIKKEELNAIIDRYMHRLDKNIEKIIQKPFHMSLGDRKELEEEIDKTGGISHRNLRSWWPFGSGYIGYDEEQAQTVLDIPVMLMKIEGATITKSADPEVIKKLVSTILPKKKKGTKKEEATENSFGDFEATFETIVDDEYQYGRVSNMTYLVVQITNKKVFDLSSVWYSNKEILKHLESFIEMENLLVNTIAEAIGTNGEKCYQSFSVTTPYLFRSAHESSVIDMTKFSKLMVQMKEKVYLRDVAGQKRAKEEVVSIIKTLKHQDVMKSWGAKPTSGIIFYGPPGTGKTLLAMVIATEVDAEVYNIKMTDIATNAFINTGANGIKDLFNFIRAKAQQNPKKHVIIILDEMDALLKKRDGANQSDEDKKIVNTFLAEMSGFDTKSNVMFIGTTNNYDSLDSAVVRSGRFSTKVKVDLPDQEGRIETFKIHMEKAKKRAQRKEIFMSDIDIQILAQESDGLSPADIEESINSIVRKRAVRESDDIENANLRTPVTMEELVESIKHIKTSNGKTNQLLKSFSPEELQKLSKKQQAYVSEAIHQLLLESHLRELRASVQSWRVNLPDLQWILDGFNPKKGGMKFVSEE